MTQQITHQSAIQSLLGDKELHEEIANKVESARSLPNSQTWDIKRENLLDVLSQDEGATSARRPNRPYTEAIILVFGRPALLIRNDSFEVPASDVWKNRLNASKVRIERAIRSVGRIELMDHESLTWVGTGWVIAPDVIVTNRHVAEEFADRIGKNKFDFARNPEGRIIRARIDYKEEYQQSTMREVAIKKIRYVEAPGSRQPDLAFLEMERSTFDLEPIALAKEFDARNTERQIAAIGYPARDSRNDNTAMVKVFGDIYNVKRLQPGLVKSFADRDIFTHDCSTLGGNSGSVIIDLESGRAVGLHFGGIFQRENYAVKAHVLLDRLAKQRITVPVVRSRQEVEDEAEQNVLRPTRETYEDRRGYDAAFLGSRYAVPLPDVKESLRNDLLAVGGSGARGMERFNLKYTHFSVVMNKTRRQAHYTACNIEGSTLQRIPRNDNWIVDPRIDERYQAGNALYSNNDLDRGHLVRRLDPVWGSRTDATRANDDTFHYTNASPQHKDLNQRTWNSLEDYVLDNAALHDLKVTVFTGPVLDPQDSAYRGVKIPREFWKVVVMVLNENNRKRLSATAYLLSQEDLISDLEGFAYGRFKTYQVAVREVEARTGILFGDLKKADPLNRTESVTKRVIYGFDNMTL